MIFDSVFNKKSKVTLLLDIGNGSISSALAIYKGKDAPYIIYSSILPISLNLLSDISSISSHVEKYLDLAITDTLKNAFEDSYFKKNKLPKIVNSALVSFSSPWFSMKSKEININKDKEFLITESFLKDVLDKEAGKFLEETSSSDDILHKGENFYVEKAVTSTKINGYYLINSLGKKTKSLDMYLYMSLVLNDMVNIVRKSISNHTRLSNSEIYLHTFPFISFSISNFMFPTTSNYLLMDITSEITDFTLVKDKTIISSASFPIGRNFVIRQISKVFDVSFEIAESFLHMFTNKKTDSNMTERIVDILSDVEKEWSIYLEDALLRLSPTMFLPTTIYITAEKDVVPLYVDFLNLSKSDNTSNFRKNIQTIHLSKDLLNKLCKFKPNIKQSEFIGMLALFNKFMY